MRAALGLAALVGLIVGADFVHAQECQRLPPAPGATGYQQRRGSDRCEGIYVSPVSGGGLQLLSLTFGRIAFDIDRDPTLFVQAPANAAAGLRLQGSGIPIGLYYRLEAPLASGAAFQLPLAAVIKPSRITSGDLGLLASREAGGGRRLFVPVHVATEARRQQVAREVTAVLRPDSDVLDMRWRLTPAGAAAGEYRALSGAQGPVPAGQRLEVVLPAWPTDGEATLELRYVDLAGRERSSRFQLATR
jgi:hypothetical protein